MQFVKVESIEIKKKITPIAYHQPQIEEASHLLIMCRKTDVKPEDIDSFLEEAAAVNELEVSHKSLQDYDKSLRVILAIPEEQQKIWMDNQVFIEMANVKAVSAVEGIDASPMEGYGRTRRNEALAFNDRHTDALLMFALGHLSEDQYR